MVMMRDGRPLVDLSEIVLTADEHSSERVRLRICIRHFYPQSVCDYDWRW